MKKKLIAICLMFMFAIAMPVAHAAESPAYIVVVSAEAPTMRAEAISKGKVTNNTVIAVNKYRQSGAVAASVKETTSHDAYEDRYASIGAGSSGVSGGDSIGIGKAAA